MVSREVGFVWQRWSTSFVIFGPNKELANGTASINSYKVIKLKCWSHNDYGLCTYINDWEGRASQMKRAQWEKWGMAWKSRLKKLSDSIIVNSTRYSYRPCSCNVNRQMLSFEVHFFIPKDSEIRREFQLWRPNWSSRLSQRQICHMIGFSDPVDLWVITIKKPRILCVRGTWR